MGGLPGIPKWGDFPAARNPRVANCGLGGGPLGVNQFIFFPQGRTILFPFGPKGFSKGQGKRANYLAKNLRGLLTGGPTRGPVPWRRNPWVQKGGGIPAHCGPKRGFQGKGSGLGGPPLGFPGPCGNGRKPGKGVRLGFYSGKKGRFIWGRNGVRGELFPKIFPQKKATLILTWGKSPWGRDIKPPGFWYLGGGENFPKTKGPGKFSGEKRRRKTQGETMGGGDYQITPGGFKKH